MSAPPISEAVARQSVDAIEDALREGFPWGKGALKEAAERLGIKGPTLDNRLDTARRLYGITVDTSVFRPRVYQHTAPGEPVIPSQSHALEEEPEGDILDVCVIGDAHDSPHLPDKSRFYWMGRYIAENRIPWVVSIGDWLTMDSLSSHTDPATHQGLAKPTFEQDMASFHESQRAFQRGLGTWKPKKDLIYGNHDGERPKRWANAHREVMGGRIDPALAVEEALAQWGWRTTPFGEYRFIGGVGFVHAPLIPGTAGKTYGGKTGGQRAANDAMFDIVRGDDHKFYVASSPKIGPVKSPRVFGTATALPPGYIETYARKNPGDWESGICRFTIWGGRVQSFSFEGMHVLRHRYGREAA